MNSNELWAVLEIISYSDKSIRYRIVESNIAHEEVWKHLGSMNVFTQMTLSNYKFEACPMTHLTKLKSDGLIIL